MSIDPMSDPYDRRLSLHSSGLLRAFNQAGEIESADVHVATRLGELGAEPEETVLLAVALLVRAARAGAVCVDLGTLVEPDFEGLSWPSVEAWREAVAGSTLLDAGVLRTEGDLFYLDRHWREERQVCEDLLARLDRRPPELDETALAGSLGRLFAAGWEEQREAALAAARQWTTVLTGGPGTGKTASVARILALLSEQHEIAQGRPPRIALAAPTGKAATRLQESVAREAGSMDAADRARVQGLSASTVHRLLGWRPGNSSRFKHHRELPLPFDIVVVDEVSMVSLSQMARLLEAVRPATRLILVGDPGQLASVEAGAVLADLVQGFAGRQDSPVLELSVNHRTGGMGTEDSARRLDRLARALRDGDADAVLATLTAETAAESPVRLVDPADEPSMAEVRGGIADAAYAVTAAAERYDPEGPPIGDLLEEHRLLCAHREGPYGVGGWNRQVERLVAERTGVTHYDEWYAGRPVLITANDRGLGLSNGDLGVTVRLPDGRLRVAVSTGGATRLFATTRLSGVETVHAMTVHKSQGSEARAVTVILPPEDSRLLTRELFYTAVTRAREQVVVVGTEAELRAAVARRAQRASGLARRLGTH